MVAGNITIGAGETDGIRQLVKAVQALRIEYPQVYLHIVSGDKTSVLEELDRGLIDFALLFGKIDSCKYESLELACIDTFGVLMRKDDPLAQKNVITPEDLRGKPLIVSRQSLHDANLPEILGSEEKNLNIVASFNLIFNGSIMVDEGIGYAITIDNIINTSGSSNLCIKPLLHQMNITMSLAWKKYQVFTKVSEKFLLKIQEIIAI